MQNALFDLAPYHDAEAAKANLGLFRFDDGELHWFFATSEADAITQFQAYMKLMGGYELDLEAEGIKLAEEPLLKVIGQWSEGLDKVEVSKTVAEWIAEAKGPGFWGSTAF